MVCRSFKIFADITYENVIILVPVNINVSNLNMYRGGRPILKLRIELMAINIYFRKGIKTTVLWSRTLWAPWAITDVKMTFSNYQLNAQFLYSSTICMLHYHPQHISSSTLLILRRTNYITTASGIVTLCRWLIEEVQ